MIFRYVQMLYLSERFFSYYVDDCGDFIDYLLGRELDVVREGLLRLVAADEHLLEFGIQYG